MVFLYVPKMHVYFFLLGTDSNCKKQLFARGLSIELKSGIDDLVYSLR